jgi:hypothetical protein
MNPSNTVSATTLIEESTNSSDIQGLLSIDHFFFTVDTQFKNIVNQAD